MFIYRSKSMYEITGSIPVRATTNTEIGVPVAPQCLTQKH